MTTRTGQISVSTKDIFPIIKKWLYSEHDIFLRELMANASDAITKRATLSRTTGQEVPAGRIDVQVNKEAKTIHIIDNGIGMTEQEVEIIEWWIASGALSTGFVTELESEKEIIETINNYLGLDKNTVLNKEISKANQYYPIIYSNIAFVDAGKIKFPLTIRKWQQGDYFYPFGMQGKKKLSKYFKEFQNGTQKR